MLAPVVRDEQRGQSLGDPPLSGREGGSTGVGPEWVLAVLIWCSRLPVCVPGLPRHRSGASSLAGWIAICGPGGRLIESVNSTKEFKEFSQSRVGEASELRLLPALGLPAVGLVDLAHELGPSHRGSTLGEVRIVTGLWPRRGPATIPGPGSSSPFMGREGMSLDPLVTGFLAGIKIGGASGGLGVRPGAVHGRARAGPRSGGVAGIRQSNEGQSAVRPWHTSDPACLPHIVDILYRSVDGSRSRGTWRRAPGPSPTLA
jgi:hypothetical protein